MGNYDDSHVSGNDFAPPTGTLSSRLTSRYLFLFAAVLGLVVVDQLVIQPFLAQMSGYAPVINVAGRQRMLSQQLAKSALALQATQDESHRSMCRSELHTTLASWRAAHMMLCEGDATFGILAIESNDIGVEWTALEPHFNAMCVAADQLVRAGSRYTDEQLAAATKTIVDHEAKFLHSMDRIVGLMESEAAGAVVRLRICAAAIAAAIVSVLLGLGWFVIRPATRTIRGHCDMLESTVSARTRELSDAVTALQHEIQEREVAESKSQRLAAQLAHADRVSSLGHLAAGLAHELNHPLATIANYAEACDVELAHVERGPQIERLTKYFDQAKQAALRAGQIVRRMRNFVRPDAPTARRAEIDGLIREVADFCRPEMKQADAELLLDLNADRATVEVDSIQIQQVLVNLLQNGLQAMVDNTNTRRLHVSSTVVAESVRIEVTDSGPGFETPDLESIFAPFQTTKSDGLGIGLAISRSIVEQHGGTIWAETPRTGGARLVFILPLTESHGELHHEPAECVCR